MESASVRIVMVPHAGFGRRSSFEQEDFFGGVLAEGGIFWKMMNTDERDEGWMLGKGARQCAAPGGVFPPALFVRDRRHERRFARRPGTAHALTARTAIVTSSRSSVFIIFKKMRPSPRTTLKAFPVQTPPGCGRAMRPVHHGPGGGRGAFTPSPEQPFIRRHYRKRTPGTKARPRPHPLVSRPHTL